MSVFFSGSLFYLSFVPLWLSVLFMDLNSIRSSNSCLYTEYISIACILIFTLISVFILLNKIRNSNNYINSTVHTLLQVEEEKTITAEFLLSYILPLFAFNFTQWDGVVLFLIYFVVLGFLCIKHNYFSVNIVLEFANYRFYKCELLNGDGEKTSQTVISRTSLTGHIGERVYLKPLNNDYQLKIK